MFLCGLFLFVLGVAHADDLEKSPVNIKVVQTDVAKGDTVQVQVVNLSTQTVIVDREALQQPDFMVSKNITEKGDENDKDLVTGASHGSIGGRWTVAQLQRREPERLVTILPGQTFTLDVEITKLLSGIDKTYPHGDIGVMFKFHDFLSAVDGKDTADDVFKASVATERTKINWR